MLHKVKAQCNGFLFSKFQRLSGVLSGAWPRQCFTLQILQPAQSERQSQRKCGMVQRLPSHVHTAIPFPKL